MKGMYPAMHTSMPTLLPTSHTDLINTALILVGGFGTRLRPLVSCCQLIPHRSPVDNMQCLLMSMLAFALSLTIANPWPV